LNAYDKFLMAMPAERRSALFTIATQLWRVGWQMDGGKGKAPSLSNLSYRNRRRWMGAALACEALMARAKNDNAHQTAIINRCIAALTELRDAEAKVEIE
jgi:hypothetical protein